MQGVRPEGLLSRSLSLLRLGHSKVGMQLVVRWRICDVVTAEKAHYSVSETKDRRMAGPT